MLIGSETEQVGERNDGGKLLQQQWIKKSDTGNSFQKKKKKKRKIKEKVTPY